MLSAQFTSSVIYYARQHVLCEEVKKLTVTSFMLRWRLIETRVELNSLLYNSHRGIHVRYQGMFPAALPGHGIEVVEPTCVRFGRA